MKKILNEGNQIHKFIFSSSSETVINYGSGSEFLTSYGSGSTSQKVTVPTVPVPQRCILASCQWTISRKNHRVPTLPPSIRSDRQVGKKNHLNEEVTTIHSS
jgi:hypothetical protein